MGCTPRFVSRNDHICKDEEDLQKAIEIYQSKLSLSNGSCLHPCNYVLITGVNVNLDAKSSSRNILNIRFDEMVTIFQAKYDYSFESMIAEIGGYVGLFLGVSVYQITGLIDYILSKMKYNFID